MKKNILTLAISAIVVTNLIGCNDSSNESVATNSGLEIVGKQHISLDINSTLQLNLAEPNKTITWKSTNTGVAKVVDGLIVPV
ncbi:TPA: hypothetical protein ACN4AY_004353 [Vibrio parahaemolyticus]